MIQTVTEQTNLCMNLVLMIIGYSAMAFTKIWQTKLKTNAKSARLLLEMQNHTRGGWSR